MKNQQASAHVKPLSLVDMSSAFVVLGLGTSLAVLVFLIELIYKRINDHYFTHHDKIKVVKARAPVVKPANGSKKGLLGGFHLQVNKIKQMPDTICRKTRLIHPISTRPTEAKQ